MRLIFFFIPILYLYSCSKPSAITRQLSGSDSIAINFNHTDGTIQKTVSATEPNAIKKLLQFVDSKPTTPYNCGYDGNILFFKNGKISGDISFNFTGVGCRHFIIELNGQLMATTLNNEAVDFLQSLREGKDWY